MVLGQIGHYFTPRAIGGSCQVALVVEVVQEGHADVPWRVNVAGFEHDGEPFRRPDVPVEAVIGTPDHASFHLTRSCPFKR